MGGIDNGLALSFAQLLELDVGFGGGGLGEDQGTNELGRHPLPTDGKVIHGALGLGTIQGVCRDLQFAHAVTFDTSVTHQEILAPVQSEKSRAATRRSPVARCSVASV
ncbi:hypothetical protein D9M70_639770 [compost metagenome]